MWTASSFIRPSEQIVNAYGILNDMTCDIDRNLFWYAKWHKIDQRPLNMSQSFFSDQRNTTFHVFSSNHSRLEHSELHENELKQRICSALKVGADMHID